VTEQHVNRRYRYPFAWFYTGVFALALVLGLLAGITASPVVGTLIPLLFALLTAGGAIYVVKGGEPGKTASDAAEQHLRASFLGRQLASFAIGFIIGLYAGVTVKFSPERIWTLDAAAGPAYSAMTFPDPTVLAAALELDNRMRMSGMPLAERRRIFSELDAAFRYRATGYHGTGGADSLYLLYGIADPDRDAIHRILGVTAATDPRRMPVTAPPD
jgi:hypothetical protein